jgi:hypothetical protein
MCLNTRCSLQEAGKHRPQELLEEVTVEEGDGKQTYARANTFATLLVEVAQEERQLNIYTQRRLSSCKIGVL